jgi:predicted RNA methylase
MAKARTAKNRSGGRDGGAHRRSKPASARQGSASSKPRRAEAPAPAKPAWLIRCAPGLARTAQAELRHRSVVRHTDRVDVLWQRNHDILFLPNPAQAPDKADLRLAEEVHRCVVYGRYKVSARQFDGLAAALRAEGRQWRLVVTAEGQHFNRHDLRRFMARELAQRGVKVGDAAPRTAFVFCVDQAYYVSVPVRAAGDLPDRTARVQEREGSLPPTVAAAMVFLARPTKTDTVLDPVCGSGTLLAEALAVEPAATAQGRDLDPKAVGTARKNLKGTTAEIDQSDAREAADLPAKSISLLLANLPFGKQFGEIEETPELYDAILREQARLAAPKGWRGVLLAADPEAVEVAAKANGFRVDKRVPVRVRGEPATIVVLGRT